MSFQASAMVRSLVFLLSVISQGQSFLLAVDWNEASVSWRSVAAGGIDNLEILTSVDKLNPYLVTEVLSTTAVSCYATADNLEGGTLTLRCPAHCGDVTEQLWGSGRYTLDSYVCAAAIHDGRIEASEGGLVTVRKLEGAFSFVGGKMNDVTSKSRENANGSYVFQDAAGAKLKTFSVSCLAQADFTDESLYLAVCPGGCDVVSEQLWGSDIYAASSYICAAAIHSGEISASQGGRVMIRKQPSRSFFNGTLQNGIQSMSLQETLGAFTVQSSPQTLSSVLPVGCGFQANHVLEDFFTVSCPPGCGDANSVVMGEDPYSVRSHVCAAAVHNGYLDGALGGVVTVHKQAEVKSFAGSRKNGVTTKSSSKPERSFVVGGSLWRHPRLLKVSCDTTVDYFLEKTFAVECPRNCVQHANGGSVTGTTVYATTSGLCMAAIHAGVITDKHGGPVTVRKIGVQSLFVGSLQHAIESLNSSAEQKAFTFGGYLDDVSSAPTVSCEFSAANIIATEFAVTCPHGCATESPLELFETSSHPGLYTATRGICKIDRQLAGKTVEIRRTSGGIKFVGNFEQFMESDDGMIRSPTRGQYTMQDQHRKRHNIISVGCDVKVSDISSRVFTALCPPGCNGSMVWGTGMYSDDSHLCGAAIHDGRTQLASGGTVTVRKMPGLDQYVGSESNDVTSMTRNEQWVSSFVFQNMLTQKASIFTISCDVTGISIESDKFTVLCVSGCQTSQDMIWGTTHYSDYSHICTAAIHAGKITSAGGLVKVKKSDPRRLYVGSYQNEVFSMSSKSSDEKTMDFE